MWYVNVPGHDRIRIKGEYGSETFMATVNASLRGEVLNSAGSNKIISKGTVAWLIADSDEAGHAFQ